MIFELIIKYLKLNPKRTGIAVITIVLSVFLLSVSSNVFVWGFDYMKEVEVQINGSWHVRYNEITKQQVDELEKRDEFSNCTGKETSEGVWQADVEFRKVDKDIFSLTEQIGEEIGMNTADIYYHMELLDFYGITEENSGASMKAILFGVLLIIMSITALLIYSVFALSFLEKKKYIGLLSCVGASLWQRRMFVLGEGIVIAIFSVPVGMFMGCIGSIAAISFMKETLNTTYQLMIQLPVRLDVGITAFAAFLGFATVGIGVIVPTVQAGRVNPLELIFKAGEVAPEEMKSKYHPTFSLEFNMAIRNLLCNKKKSIKMILFIILAIALGFNGYIAIQDIRGVWLLEDTRETKPLDAWVQIHSDDVSVEEDIKNKIASMSWCEDVNYMSVLDLGAFVIDKKYVNEEFEECHLPWRGHNLPTHFWDERNTDAEKVYAFHTKIVGIDDDTFEQYLKENGDIAYYKTAQKEEKYVVIMDDLIPVKKQGQEYAKYNNALDIDSGEEINIKFGTYADYFVGWGYIDRGGTGPEWNKEIALTVCSTAKARLPYPVEIGAWGMVSDDYTQMESYYVRFYMPNSQFQHFIKEENLKETYGEQDVEAKGSQNHAIRYENPILNYICIDRVKGADEKVIYDDLLQIMEESGFRPYQSLGETYINDSNSWEYGNAETLNRMKIMKNAGEILREIFMIGAILLIFFLTIFSLIQYTATSIYMRKHEFAVLKSMGMQYQNLKRMLFYENIILILFAAVAGASFSWWEAYTQLRDIKAGAATVEIHFPFDMFVIVVLGLIVLTSMIVLVMIRRVKRVNIIDALKNENE